MDALDNYTPVAVTNVGHVPRPTEADRAVAVNGIRYHYSPAEMVVCSYFQRFAFLKGKKNAKMVMVKQFRLGSMGFAAPDDIAEEASQAICQLCKIPKGNLFSKHTCPHCTRRFCSYTDWFYHIQ